MKKYVLGRILRSIFSIFAVVCVAIVMIFALIPRDKFFQTDTVYGKLKGDELTNYKYNKWEDLGYLDYLISNDICNKSDDPTACMAGGNALTSVMAEYRSYGYTIDYHENGYPYIKIDEKTIDAKELCSVQANVDACLANVDALKAQMEPYVAYGYTLNEDADGLPYLHTSSYVYEMEDLCAKTDNADACEVGAKKMYDAVMQARNEGYTVDYYYTLMPYGSKDYSMIELVMNFFSNLIKIDNPWAVNDGSNPNLERKYYIEAGPNGIPAVKCSGCEYQYQLYINGNFPFIHQNVIRLNFGKSYPTFSGIDTLDVINGGQGNVVNKEVTFPTGITQKSSTNLYSCRYKDTSTLDHLDQAKFNTNYANCTSNYDSLSMTGVSYTFGVLALVIAYLISIPAGVSMARNKDKLKDKIGIVYINLMISVPSLAFIYFLKVIGMNFGLPDKFPQFGFGDFRSYILPILILALLSTSGIMIWIRRYMIDQSNADYVKFAKAKGLTQKEIFNRHILKNAIIPIVNGIPASIIGCISGSVITESVFAIPGMGKMLPDSIKAFNNNMVITLTFIFTALSVFSLLLGDLLMTVVDPRIQLATKGDKK